MGLVQSLDCQARGHGFKSPPGQKTFIKISALLAPPFNSASMGKMRRRCQRMVGLTTINPLRIPLLTSLSLTNSKCHQFLEEELGIPVYDRFIPALFLCSGSGMGDEFA